MSIFLLDAVTREKHWCDGLLCRRRAVVGIQQSLLHSTPVGRRSVLRHCHAESSQRRGVGLRLDGTTAVLYWHSTEETVANEHEWNWHRDGHLTRSSVSRRTCRWLDWQATTFLIIIILVFIATKCAFSRVLFALQIYLVVVVIQHQQ